MSALLSEGVMVAPHAMSTTDPQEIVQPSKEWVLPARGKPGRKLSTNVPMTKRKAQNRESQRAFRERKSAYLLELQQKVAQFEAREVEANVQMQHLALQYRQEAEALRAENTRLTQQCRELAQQLQALQHTKGQSEDRAAPQSSGSCSPVKLRSVPPSPAAVPATLPLPRPPAEEEDDELDIDCIFCPGKSQCVCRGHASLPMDDASPAPATPSAVALPARTLAQKRLWYTVEPANQIPRARPPPSASSTTSSPPLRPGYVRIRRRAHHPVAHLWKTRPATRACTGDPATCSACQSDPQLQQFCHTVSRTAQRPVSAARESSACESVPAAFQRLQSHHNFPKSRDGLDMLAEVVARDSVGESKSESQDTPMPEQPRLLVRSSAVSEALALLDRPAPDVACACPWAQTPSRLPWPR
ncbi:hypothetical protein MCAP1_002383 [Malassezia caprae]|uniref:BZIP domain-containing protein n=1 Tax=Malassezia caprae TaxID=1381934 RepID=A0AAF0IVS8_9BASI|nr:hypothetical protein MCAP1_002383 [Malassezia caprae]